MTSQNPSSLILSPTTRFKPYISHKKWALEPLTGDFRKRYYKHIRSLSLKPDETLLRRMPMPKTLHSLNLDSWKPDQNLAYVKKFLKQYQKYLRNIQGSSNHPKIQKLLPHLADREVNVKEDSLRTLFFYSGFKRLQFNFERLKKDAGEALLRKYKAPLSRNLTTINGLEALSMNIAMQEAKSAILLLEMIDQNLPLDSLKQCSLIFASGLGSTGPQKVPEQKANISKVLAKLTDLSLESTHWYCYLISSGKFANLSVLNLKLFSKQISCDLKDVINFHNLSTLKNCSLYFDAHSLSSERSFFEDFTLPASIEALSLSLAGFTLSLIDDGALIGQFFNRLQEAKGVKVLNLKIAENPSNLSQTAKFACLLIKCFDRLGTLNYMTPKQDSFLFKEGGAQSPPAEFHDFWAALGNSKETLYNISLHAPEMILPQAMSVVLETGFLKLQKLELQGGILLGTELARFCQKINSLTNLTLKEMRFQDEEKLKLFLDEIKEIPKEGRFELHLDVAKIKQELLVDCLKKYIEDAKVKGQLKIYFTKVQAGDKQAFDEISKLAMEKGCFEVFQMTMGHSNRLFSVEKNKIIQVTSGLFM